MKRTTRLRHYLHAAGRYLDDPRLFLLRRRGVLVDIFERLEQPWFQQLGIRTVLDIGANVGQFARTIGAVLPGARVYAFEPLPDCFVQLQRELGASSNFAAFNIALGEVKAVESIERNQYSPSSSFLTMNETHHAAFPYTGAVARENVQVERLDDVASQLKLVDPLLIKVDVQGYELHVFAGGEETIKRAKLLIVETSFETLYDDQPLFDDVYRRLASWGFVYAGALEQLVHPESGRVLQADSMFVKP